MNHDKPGRVLVTGAAGFVAGHCIADLLARGYDMRGTVRNLGAVGLAEILRQEYGPRGYKISTRPLPPWIVHVAARVNSEAKLADDMLGIPHDVSVEKAVRELGWTPRTLRQSVLDTAESVIGAGVVAPGKQRMLTR